MPTIRISETYDLSTTVNRLGLIAIHTPSSSLVYKLYPGLFLNFKYMHVDRCDMAVACASIQPADPLQVGTEAGDIAPQDLFNPILYRAVSNDAYNTIINRVYASDYSPANEYKDGSVSTSGNIGSDPFTVNSFDHYYALLGDSGWKKAMPQSGFSMTNLKPMVYSVVSTFGNTTVIGTDAAALDDYGVTGSNGAYSNRGGVTPVLRGSVRPFPRVPTVRGNVNPTYNANTGAISSISTPTLIEIPKTFVAVIVTPPAKQHRLYYRLRVIWTISFIEPVSVVERGNLATIQNTGINTYTDYITAPATSSTKAARYEEPDVSLEMVDTQDVTAEQIMQR